MAEILVDAGGMKTQESQLQNIINQLGKVEIDLNSVNNKIARCLESRAYQNVRQSISRIDVCISQNKVLVQSLKITLTSSRELYQNTETKVASYFAKSSQIDWSQTSISSDISGSSSGVFDFINDLLNNIKKDDDIIPAVKSILNALNAWGGVKKAGVASATIAYVKDLATFLTGDKKGATGAANFCSLTDSSISLWKGLYDYLAKDSDATTGLFGENAKKIVGKAGIAAEVMGLMSSVISASDGLNEKKWQNAVADYVDCGKDVVSIAKSVYKLKNIGAVKALSGANIYFTLAEAGVDMVSQGFKSYEKYSADGKWDLEDTAAIAIDVATAGLYGFTHSITFGLDDILFSLIADKPDNMSYAEMAAEELKKLGKDIGNFLGI